MRSDGACEAVNILKTLTNLLTTHAQNEYNERYKIFYKGGSK